MHLRARSDSVLSARSFAARRRAGTATGPRATSADDAFAASFGSGDASCFKNGVNSSAGAASRERKRMKSSSAGPSIESPAVLISVSSRSSAELAVNGNMLATSMTINVRRMAILPRRVLYQDFFQVMNRPPFRIVTGGGQSNNWCISRAYKRAVAEFARIRRLQTFPI